MLSVQGLVRLLVGRRDPWDLLARHPDGRMILIQDLPTDWLTPQQLRQVREHRNLWLAVEALVERPKCLLATCSWPLAAQLQNEMGPPYIVVEGATEEAAQAALTRVLEKYAAAELTAPVG